MHGTPTQGRVRDERLTELHSVDKNIRLAYVRVCAHVWTTGMGLWRSAMGTRGFAVNEREGHLSSTERSSQGVGV